MLSRGVQRVIPKVAQSQQAVDLESWVQRQVENAAGWLSVAALACLVQGTGQTVPSYQYYTGLRQTAPWQ